MNTTNDTPKAFPSDNPRAVRGLALAKKSGKRIRHITAESYFVPSSTGGTAGYVVDAAAGTCTCDDHELRGDRCKHGWALLIARREVTVPGGFTMEDKKPTYRQKDWSAYTRVQESEKSTVQTLLRSLCAGIVEPRRVPKRGNQPLALSDLAFATVMKIYTGMSGRRATTDIRACERDGFIDHAPTHSAIAKFLENPAANPILTRLVEESARPLTVVEEHFSPDSSGFSSSCYADWKTHKYGVESKVHRWVKLHALVGVRSHVIVSANVTGGTESDSPQFVPMLQSAQASGFDMKEVSADKGYLSVANLTAAEATGAAVFVPFKSNSVAGTNEVWKRLFLYFTMERETFLAAYHKRSNVESVFSSMKRKFGGSVRSKLPVAQENEVLAKCVAHNLSMLAHAIGEFDVDAKFWTPRPPPSFAPTTEVAA